MSTTALLALLLGTVLVPVYAVKAVVAPDGPAAALCGIIALMAALGAVALIGLAVRMSAPRPVSVPCVHHEEIAEWNNPCLRCRGGASR